MQHRDPTRSDVDTMFNADQAQSVLISRKNKADELSMEMDTIVWDTKVYNNS